MDPYSSNEAGTPGDAVAWAYSNLRSGILDGTIPAGTVLSQVTLARSMQISRTPLREALRLLASEGLVTGDFNRRLRVTSLDLRDFDQIYALRISVEPLAIRSTVPRLAQAEKSRLSTHVSGMDDALARTDMHGFRSNHRSFHLGLTAYAGPRVEALLAELWDHSERYRLRYMHADVDGLGGAMADRVAASQAEHRLLLQAAIEGEAELCANLLVSHLSRTLDAVLAEMSDESHPRLTQLVRVPGETPASGRN